MYFGKETNKNFIQFIIHCYLIAFPGFFLGMSVEKISEKLDGYPKISGFFQLTLNIFILFLLSNYTERFASEFQKTYTGLFFVALYFNSQTNFINRLGNLKNLL